MSDHRPFHDFPRHRARPSDAPTPLAGIRVLDFSHFIAGPFATMLLGDMGADVIKVETLRGDDFRLYPPAERGMDAGAPFLWGNRNKRSIALDLKSPEGLQIAKDLAALADVVVENFSTGVMERLGLCYESLSALNPRLVYCSISAYGRSGRFADRLGFDQIVQAESGFLSMNGYADREGVRAQPVVMDTATAMVAANGVLAALLARHATGRGQRVDLSLYDCAMVMTGFASVQYLLSGRVPQRAGNTSNDTSPTGVFRTRNRPIYVTCSTTIIFRRLFAAIGRADLADDPDLQTVVGRLHRRDELFAVMNEMFAQHDLDHWTPLLTEAGCAFGEVRTLPEAIESETTRESGLVTRIAHPVNGEIPNLGNPLHLSDTPLADPVAAPAIGEHSEEVLRDLLGYDQGALDELAARRVFVQARPAPERP